MGTPLPGARKSLSLEARNLQTYTQAWQHCSQNHPRTRPSKTSHKSKRGKVRAWTCWVTLYSRWRTVTAVMQRLGSCRKLCEKARSSSSAATCKNLVSLIKVTKDTILTDQGHCYHSPKWQQLKKARVTVLRSVQCRQERERTVQHSARASMNSSRVACKTIASDRAPVNCKHKNINATGYARTYHQG